MKKSLLKWLLISILISVFITALLTDFKFDKYVYADLQYPGEPINFYSITAVQLIIGLGLLILLLIELVRVVVKFFKR
jgi:uncharacterized membrane protein (DUF373 family)